MLDLFDVDVPRDVGMLWGTDYLNRTGIAKSNMYDNRPEETKYIYTDDDSQGKQLDGRNTHAITCQGGSASGQGLLVAHLVQLSSFLQPEPAEPILAGHKEQNLKVRYGWLTHAGAKSPGQDKESNWLPAPSGTFSLYLRAYWADKTFLDGEWKPPAVEKLNGAAGRALQ